MRALRLLWRGLRVAEHLLTGALICTFISLLAAMGRGPAWVPAVVRWWHGRLCRALGLRIQVFGSVANHCLLVANHISWLDIPVLGAQAELGFLSKAEVRGWPLVGWMSAVAGTLFIERGANQAATVSDQIASAIASGRTLVIFPEGTTCDGREVRRFHPRLFAAARQPGLRVQPAALAYRRGADLAPDLTVPFVGEETLAANLWRVLRHPGLLAEVRFLSPIEPEEGEDRRRFAARARQAIVASLGLDPASLPSDASPPGAHASVAELDGSGTRADGWGTAPPAMARPRGLVGIPRLDRFIERRS
jgi:1-acyl-sn-glycerol-3-phosphate acyltransferase